MKIPRGWYQCYATASPQYPCSWLRANGSDVGVVSRPGGCIQVTQCADVDKPDINRTQARIVGALLTFFAAYGRLPTRAEVEAMPEPGEEREPRE